MRIDWNETHYSITTIVSYMLHKNEQTFSVASTAHRRPACTVHSHRTSYIPLPSFFFVSGVFKGRQTFKFVPTFAHFCHAIVSPCTLLDA